LTALPAVLAKPELLTDGDETGVQRRPDVDHCLPKKIVQLLLIQFHGVFSCNGRCTGTVVASV
jgi:hypothetical protein